MHDHECDTDISVHVSDTSISGYYSQVYWIYKWGSGWDYEQGGYSSELDEEFSAPFDSSDPHPAHMNPVFMGTGDNIYSYELRQVSEYLFYADCATSAKSSQLLHSLTAGL